MQTSAVLTMDAVTHVSINSDNDVINARRWGRSMALGAQFGPVGVTIVSAAISELARNIVLHATRGEIALQLVERDQQLGIRIVASDAGPGIADLAGAMRLGYSTTGGSGLGLAAVKRVVDEFVIDSTPASGTRIVVTKWCA